MEWIIFIMLLIVLVWLFILTITTAKMAQKAASAETSLLATSDKINNVFAKVQPFIDYAENYICTSSWIKPKPAFCS